jgi:DNA-binding MarR family transcriptional regulator
LLLATFDRAYQHEASAPQGTVRAVSGWRNRYGSLRGDPPEALCLCSVSGGCTLAGDLGEEVTLSPSRLSRVLGALETKGLLERTRRKDDKRTWDLALTAEGAALVARMRDGEIELPVEIREFSLVGKE